MAGIETVLGVVHARHKVAEQSIYIDNHKH